MLDYKPTRFMLPTSHYDKQRADRAVNFIRALRHTKGEFYNKPFMLLDWQETIIRDLFGIIREDGTRQFRQAIVFTPKKAGKTELAAAIALYLLCADGEQRAEIYGAAVDRQQASLIYSVAADMIRLTPALKKRCKILDSRKRIIFTPTNSFYQVLSSDADRAHGVSAHGVLIDEIHNQKNPDLFNVLTKGSGDARRQPIQFVISTAGDNIHSIGYELFQKAKDIIDGRKTDPTIYPVIYAADPDDDWTDPEVWKKANPSLGVTFPIEKLQEACDSAKQNPSEVNTFLQLRLNIWTKQAVRWMPMDRWDACNAPVDAEALRGRPCYAGLDLSSTQDLTALVPVISIRREDEN